MGGWDRTKNELLLTNTLYCMVLDYLFVYKFFPLFFNLY